MSEENPSYFQFPLGCLAFGKTVEDRLGHVISWCAVDVGITAWKKLDCDEGRQSAVLSRLGQASSNPDDFNEESQYHTEAIYGASILNVRLGAVRHTIAQFQSLSTFIASRESHYGRDVDVRLRTDLVWDAKKETLPYREFSVLAAVYATIGNNKGPVRITRDMIRDRQLGYKSRIATGPTKRIDGAKPLTVRQIRDTLDKLELRGLFSRINPSPRKAFFSNRLNVEQLASAVLEFETKRLEKRASKESLNLQVQQAIEQKKREIRQRNERRLCLS